MQEVSKEWKEAQNKSIVPESYVEIRLNAGDQNAQNTAVATSNNAVDNDPISHISDTREITKETVEPVNYATLEPGLWRLDGQSRILGSDISDPHRDFKGFVPYTNTETMITADGCEFFCAKEYYEQEQT